MGIELKTGRRETVDVQSENSFSAFLRLLVQKHNAEQEKKEKEFRYKRILVKVGSGVIGKNGKVDHEVVSHLVHQIASLVDEGVEVIFVTSGAVATGRELFSKHGKEVKARDMEEDVDKQTFASVGQPELMSLYKTLFGEHGYLCGQVLLIKRDFEVPEPYVTVKNAIEDQLQKGIIPIVNENDVVATQELLFTDNDELSGFVAAQMNVDAVILLTSVEGVLSKAEGDQKAEVISEITLENLSLMERHVSAETSSSGRGGMHTKFAVARKLMAEGIAVHIANGTEPDVIHRIVRGKKVGTEFIPVPLEHNSL